MATLRTFSSGLNTSILTCVFETHTWNVLKYNTEKYKLRINSDEIILIGRSIYLAANLGAEQLH